MPTTDRMLAWVALAGAIATALLLLRSTRA